MPTPSQSSSDSPTGEKPGARAGASPRTRQAANLGSPRNWAFGILLMASLWVFRMPLRTLLHYALWEDNPYDKYSYTLAIPLVSLAMVWFERSKILARVQYGFGAGVILLLAGLILKGFAGRDLPLLGADNALSAQIFALVLCWLGAFLLGYGTGAFRAGAFPLLFLLLTVPMPDWLLDKPVTAVQYGSAEVCSWVFALGGVPVLRTGLEFILANTAIEVAKECSGIHSTLAIFIISFVAGHLFLSTATKRVVLVLLALPIVCVTNGLRIAGLTLLAEYVSPSFLYGRLHREGGLGFFLLALALLFAILRLLRGGQRPETFGVKPSATGNQVTSTHPEK